MTLPALRLPSRLAAQDLDGVVHVYEPRRRMGEETKWEALCGGQGSAGKNDQCMACMGRAGE